MPERGQQFPLHSPSYFREESDSGRPSYVATHVSTHSIDRGDGVEKLSVSHTYNPTHGRGELALHGEGGKPVAKLSYHVQEAERATSLKMQHVIHTGLVEVEEEFSGLGLASHMMDRVKQAHPGVSHPASNELTAFGAPWRAHRVEKGQDNGERLAWGHQLTTDHPGLRIYRPVEPDKVDSIQKYENPPKVDTKSWLMEEGRFDPEGMEGEGMEHDKWVSKASKIKGRKL